VSLSLEIVDEGETQIRWFRADNGAAIIQVNVSGNAGAEMEIEMTAAQRLTPEADWFL
jgi:hypothetical protein